MEDRPLMSDADNANVKRPTLLYLINLVLVVAVIILVVLLITKKSDCEENKCNCPQPIPNSVYYNTSHFIEINESFYSNHTEGSHYYQGKLNHFDSPYFKMVDIFNMKSNENLTILSNFKTYQQTSEYSSHCAAIIMIQNYYGDSPVSERQCMIDIGVTDPDNFEADDAFYKKLNLKNVENYINSLGYTTTSNDNYTEENFPFNDTVPFGKYAREVLKRNETMLINWADWGATMSIVIGIDTMGNEEELDQVIIFADTYDTCDHLNDGYSVIGLDKFYFNWVNNKIYYLDDETYGKYATGRFIIIHRKNGS